MLSLFGRVVFGAHPLRHLIALMLGLSTVWHLRRSVTPMHGQFGARPLMWRSVSTSPKLGFRYSASLALGLLCVTSDDKINRKFQKKKYLDGKWWHNCARARADSLLTAFVLWDQMTNTVRRGQPWMLMVNGLVSKFRLHPKVLLRNFVGKVESCDSINRRVHCFDTPIGNWCSVFSNCRNPKKSSPISKRPKMKIHRPWCQVWSPSWRTCAQHKSSQGSINFLSFVTSCLSLRISHRSNAK